MLSIFLQLFCCAHQKASSDGSQNICQQLCSFVNSRLDCKEYFLLKKSSKSLYVCVEICDEFFSCSYWNIEMQRNEGHKFEVAYAKNTLTTKIGTLMHDSFKSFSVDNVFIYAKKDGLNHLCKEDVQEKLINALRMLSCGESGPKYYFKGYVPDELSLIARTVNKNNEWEKRLKSLKVGGNLDIRLDSDKDFYFVFDIDLSYFNFKLLLKNFVIFATGNKNGRFYKFISNFDFVYSYDIKRLVDRIMSDRHDLLELKKLSCEERREKLLLEGRSFTAKLSNESAFAYFEWINKISKRSSHYIKKIEKIVGRRCEMILVFMFSILRRDTFKILLAHVLSSKPNFKKSLIAEILFQLNVIDKETMDNLLQKKNLPNLQSWKEKIDDEFLAPLFRLTNMLPFHNTLIRYLFVILFAEMISLEKDCKEIKDCLRRFHSDYGRLCVATLSGRKIQTAIPIIDEFETLSEKVSSTLYFTVLIICKNYEFSFTDYVYKELSMQCKKIMDFSKNPTRRIKNDEKEHIAALYKKMKLIVATSLYETS